MSAQGGKEPARRGSSNPIGAMRAIDTNILVYAEIKSMSQHKRARLLLTELAQGTEPWAIPWPCIYEFLRVVSHPKIFHPPMPMAVARADLDQIFHSPTLVLLAETERHTSILDRLLEKSGASGNLVHDAHIAALCLEHGVSELLTADRDFARFPEMRTMNPFA